MRVPRTQTVERGTGICSAFLLLAELKQVRTSSQQFETELEQVRNELERVEVRSQKVQCDRTPFACD